MPSKTNRTASALRFPGSKGRLLGQINDLAPRAFNEFREPFVGGGSVYLWFKQTRPEVKSFWINDLFEPVSNFWAMLSQDSQEVTDQVYKFLAGEPQGQKLFVKLKAEYSTYDPVDRAAAWFIINRISFSGLGFSGGYSRAAFEGRCNPSHISKLVKVGAALGEKTQITNLDYKEVMEAEGEDVFLFLDPPYSLESSNLYGMSGSMHLLFDHASFASVCKNSKHRWLVTYNDSQEIRELFSPWATINEIPVKYSINSTQKLKTELFITNY